MPWVAAAGTVVGIGIGRLVITFASRIFNRREAGAKPDAALPVHPPAASRPASPSVSSSR